MIEIDKSKKAAIYIQIYRQIRNDILDGTLPAYHKLKSIRQLSDELNVGINTIKKAYKQLVQEGFIENKPRSSFEVANLKMYSPQQLKTTEFNPSLKEPQIPQEKKYKYDFTYMNQSIDLFPISKWRKHTTEALLGFDNTMLGSYGNQKGEVELRQEIQKYLKLSRGVQCNIDQIILCTGIQDSIERICRISPQCKVAIEQPGLPLWWHIFESFGFSIVPIDVYPENHYLQDLQLKKASIIVTTPSHQFPTGYTMSMSERLQLIQWAANHDVVIIEDDYDCEFRYDSQPISAMQSIDNYGCVIYFGTFSKILLPSLRVSYMVLPERFLTLYDNLYSKYPTSIPWLSQKVLYHFMHEGDFEKHVRKTRYTYMEKYNLLISACREILGKNVEIIGSDAGLHILLRINKASSQNDLISKAALKDVKIYSTSEYWYNKETSIENLILLGFSLIAKEDIYAGIVHLKEAWHEFL